MSVNAVEQARPEPGEAARSILLRSLEASPKTRSQLAELLRRRGVPSDAAVEVLDRFEDAGLIDDAAFAQMWVRSRHAGKGLSRAALRHELSAKGVDPADIDGALASVSDEDERAAARQLVQRAAPRTYGLDYATRRRRLIGLLGRRGYSPGLASSVVSDVLGESGET